MTCEALEWKLLLTASIITLTRGRQWVAGAGSSHVFIQINTITSPCCKDYENLCMCS